MAEDTRLMSKKVQRPVKNGNESSRRSVVNFITRHTLDAREWFDTGTVYVFSSMFGKSP